MERYRTGGMITVMLWLVIVIGDTAPAGAAGAAARPTKARLPTTGAARAAAIRLFLVMAAW